VNPGCQEEGIAATPKHFVANDAENQRTTLSVDVDEQTLREIYLLPFQLIMKLADPWCFMTSYNKVNGTYVADSERLIQDVLRDEWGFEGVVMSDWMGTYSTARGVNAGVELEMPGPTKWRGEKLLQAVCDGEVSEATIDKRSIKVLELANRLGRFENPEEPPESAADNPERDHFIAYSAAEGIVLLKNENAILPIPRDDSVAMIGHFASHVCLGGGGSARVDAIHAESPVDGIKKLGYNTKLAPGIPVFGAVPHADPAIVFETGSSHHSPAPVKLEWFNGNVIGQHCVYEEMKPQAEYMIKEKWPSYLSKDYCTRMTFDLVAPSTGHHTFSVISTGHAKCYIDGKMVFNRPQETDLKLESFYFFKSKLERRFKFDMTKGRRYSISMESWACDPDILNAPPLFGKMFQGGALRFHEHIDEEACKRDAAEAARSSKYAVVCVGNTAEIESEGFDRDTMDLMQCQYDLINAVVEANPRTVVVNFSGAPVTMSQFVDKVPAIVQAWFPGQECGHSVAAVLSGIINPCGRLPLSWPREYGDNPTSDNFPVGKDLLLHYEEGLNIGYRYYDRVDTPAPLFEFGFGLSYTTFEATSAAIRDSGTISSASDRVKVDCEVENTGEREGKVVVQYYVKSPNVSFGRPRPVKELKAFIKINLKPGERQLISVELDKYAVSAYDSESSCWRAEKGTYEVEVGFSTRKIASSTSFVVAEAFKWRGI
jgi:beta-glucosidase